jgi:predicted nucleic acid-binding Zn ribbon protein
LARGRERQSHPEKLGDILARFLKDSGLDRPRKTEDLDQAWADVAGNDVARLSRVASFQRGIFTVEIRSAPLRQELELFRREELLLGLQERVRSVFVQELRFRLA